MANCCNCSAPLPANSLACGYCGTRNDVDLTGIHYNTTYEPDALRNCPRCGIPLKTVDLKVHGRFLIERCDQCLGLFFDPGELEALLDASVTNVFTVNKSQLQVLNTSLAGSDYGVTYVKCPVCSTFMNRVNYGGRSGIIIDQCREHGVWLDGGELRHLMEWSKAGGKLLARERSEQEKKELEREKAKPQTPITYGYDDSEDRSLRYEEVELLDVVCRAVAWLLR